MESGLAGWSASGGELLRTLDGPAPDGRATATAAATAAGQLAIRAASSATTIAERRYETTVSLARPLTRGTDPVTVRVVELGAGGAEVASSSATVEVGAGFERVVLEHRAVGAGHGLAVEVSTDAVVGEMLRADALGVAEIDSTLGALTITWDQGGQALGDTSAFNYVALLWVRSRDVATIKANNPDTDALLYLDMGAVRYRRDCDPAKARSLPYAPESMSHGVDYCWIVANGHEDWILRNRDGSYAEYQDYRDFLLIDPAAVGYRNQFATNAIYAAHEPVNDFDGIYLDDVNTIFGHGLTEVYRRVDGRLVSYSTDQYAQDVVGFMQHFESRLDADSRGRDLVTMANVYGDPWKPVVREQLHAIGKTVDMLNREHQIQWKTGFSFCGPHRGFWPDEINAIMDFATETQARHGNHFSTMEYGGSDQARESLSMPLARASFLLSWDGTPGSVLTYRPCGNVPSADRRWMSEIGLPAGPTQTLKSEQVTMPGQSWQQTAKLLHRRFTRGLVLMNQLPHRVTVQLDGTYVDQESTRHTGSISLGPALTSATDPTGQGMAGGAAVLTRVGLHQR